MKTSGHLWAIGYADMKRAAEVRDEIVKMGWDKHDLILEDVAVFENICASLKPGGMLLISTPSDQGGSDVHGEGEG